MYRQYEKVTMKILFATKRLVEIQALGIVSFRPKTSVSAQCNYLYYHVCLCITSQYDANIVSKQQQRGKAHIISDKTKKSAYLC